MKKIIHLMFYGLIACGALVFVAIPVRAQSTRGTKTKVATGDTSRQLQRERERVSREIDSLKILAVGTNRLLEYQDSLQGRTQRELQTMEGSPRGRLDRRRIDSLDVSVKAQGRKKDSLQHQFDHLLISLDSMVRVQQELNEQLKAKRDL